MGVNRWLYRVLVYVASLRDEYPPFRLDQGPHELEDVVVGPRSDIDALAPASTSAHDRVGAVR